MSVIQNLLLDLIAALWVSALFIAVFFWLPGQLMSSAKAKSPDSRAIAAWARMTLVAVAGVLSLSTLRLFSWFTLVLFCGLCFLLGWLFRHRRGAIAQLTLALQPLAFATVDWLDRGLFAELQQVARQSGRFLKIWLVRSLRSIRIAIEQNKLAVLALLVIFTFAILLRLEHPLLELRFSHPDSYRTLLITRQFLAGEQPQVNYVPVLPALATVVSLLGAIDAMQVIRFLSPLLGLLLVLSVGYHVRVLTQNTTAALIATYSLGAYLFTWHKEIHSNLPDWLQQWLSTIVESLNTSLIRQWAAGELEIGATFLLLAIACCCNAGFGKQRQSAGIDIVCCLAIVTMTAPLLLILAFVGGIGLLGGRRFALAVVAIAWIALALLAASPENQQHWGQSFLLTLPIGLSLLWGLLSLLAIWLLSLILRRWSHAVCLILVFAFSLNFLLPLPPQIPYLEYDIAARKTLELRMLFPNKSWAIVAPVEQFSQSYGAGWYQDLAQVVNNYVKKVGNPDFKFPFSTPHLFIFVEKKPFITSAIAPQNVPYSLLSDPTYRYYRSAAGRASVQYEALQMCEAYRRTHANTSIYYEDDELRIYYFLLSSTS
ncbi:hypothetical protein NIES593_04915 [Hydrococcus rivularis NIES-593]|uniref:Glycosyltransferase RgtA/B/C/D-like domain-containing protein n=1 Tax=Hydrococcus rivularis NIES-593 TaxID=1921803 RepID=A0A1U7HQ74_9CYAN|nr:hypothetical protein [Hydrococcus rivularis]OKH25675.1 hypothetical protein NIES593_04915 [Hydrococcus rivularis NIES-593]